MLLVEPLLLCWSSLDAQQKHITLAAISRKYFEYFNIEKWHSSDLKCHLSFIPHLWHFHSQMRWYWCLTCTLYVCVCVQMSFVFHRENSVCVCVGGTENLLNHRLHLHPSLHSSYTHRHTDTHTHTHTHTTHTHTHITSLSLIHAGIPQWHLIFHHALFLCLFPPSLSHF